MIARLAAREANRLGASTELLTLSDFSILECEGCMRCLFRGKRCHLQDDAYSLLDKISDCDAFFVVAPTYVLTIPGALKLVLDRYFLISSYHRRISGRRAVSIGVAALRGWEQLELPLLNLFLLSLGFTISESLVAYGAGPGEVLLDPDGVARVKAAVRKLSSPLDGTRQLRGPVVSSHCPICFSTLFERIEQGVFRCPVCLAVGEERSDGFAFSEDSLRQHRFSSEKMKAHLEEWVLGTRESFRRRLPEISRIRREMGL